MKRIGIIVMILALVLVQCKFKEEEDQKQNDQVRIVYPNWTEGIALAYLIKVILSDRLYYDVVIKMDDVDDAYAAIAGGDYEIFPDAWLPNTHKRYWNRYQNQLVDLGVVYSNAKTGIVVPQYMDINSIGDTKELAKNEQIIYGIDAYSGIMESARKAVKDYNPDLLLTEADEREMLHRLEEAFRKRQNILITGWEPHWMFRRYELKFLEDPDSVFGGYDNIHILGHRGIKERFPTMTIFLERIELSDKQMNSLLDEIEAAGGTPERGVRNWIRENVATVNSWIHGLRVKRRYSE